MRTLTPAARQGAPTLDRIIAAKRNPRRTLLRTLQPGVVTHYASFEAAGPNLSALSPAGYLGDDREALQHCYDGPTQPLEELSADIRARQPQPIQYLCPYCGIDRSQELDHYLPKEAFPEFSVHPLNLVPACGVCNKAKGHWYAPAGAPREVVHPYLDPVLDVIFLVARIDYVGGDPRATFALVPGAVPTGVFELIERHVERLDLLARFSLCANEVFEEARSLVMTHAATMSPAEAGDALKREADRWAGIYRSASHWRPVTFRALAADPAFVATCCQP